jgi:MFS family permease
MFKSSSSPSIFSAVPPKVKWLILLMSFSSLATGYFWVATSAYLPEVGLTGAEVGLLLSINGVAFIIAAIPMGVLADRTGRKRIMLLGVMGMPPALLIYALTKDMTFLLAASAVAGVAEGAFLTTWNAMIADMTGGEARKEAFSLSFIVNSVSTGLGFALPLAFPLISGLSGWSGSSIHEAFFVIMAAVSLITPIALAKLLKDYQETPAEPVPLRKGKNMGPMLKFSALNSLIGLGAGFIIPLIPLWLLDRFGVTDTYSGPLLAVANLTIGFASIASAGLARRYGTVGAIVLCQGTSTFFMLSLAFVPNAAAAGVFYITRSALMNMAAPLTDSFLMGIISKEERGLASAINSIVWRLPHSVTTVVGGVLLGMGYYDIPFFLATAFYAVSISLFYFTFRGVEPKE